MFSSFWWRYFPDRKKQLHQGYRSAARISPWPHSVVETQLSPQIPSRTHHYKELNNPLFKGHHIFYPRLFRADSEGNRGAWCCPPPAARRRAPLAPAPWLEPLEPLEPFEPVEPVKPVVAGSRNRTTWNPWLNPLLVGSYRKIRSGFARCCEMEFVHPQYGALARARASHA